MTLFKNLFNEYEQISAPKEHRNSSGSLDVHRLTSAKQTLTKIRIVSAESTYPSLYPIATMASTRFFAERLLNVYVRAYRTSFTISEVCRNSLFLIMLPE